MSKANIPVTKGVAPRFRGIPAVDEGDPGSLWNTVKALVEIVETLVGQRGDTRNKAILLNDLLDDSTDPLKRPELEGIHNYLRADDHLALSPSAYTEDPHKQYWHKALDPAYARLRIATDTGPFSAGQTIKPWLLGPPLPFHTSVDAPNGAMTIAGIRQLGVYGVYFSATILGTAGATYTFTLHVDGAPTTIVLSTTLGTQQTIAALAGSTLLETSKAASRTIEWRLTTATSTCTIKNAEFAISRIAPLRLYFPEAKTGDIHGYNNGFTTGFAT